MKTIFRIYNDKIFIQILAKVFLTAFFFQFYSCEKAIELDYPDFLLPDEAVFENVTTIEAALADIYAGLRDSSPVMGGTDGMGALLGLYTDELDYYSPDALNDMAFYNHTVLPINTAILQFWDSSYRLIYKANAIIDGLEKSTLPESEKGVFVGEALFLRAYLHFNLVQLYGDIPYIKSINYKENAVVSRMSQVRVFEAIKEDLINAKATLENVDNSGERLKASKGAASALLARLYLIQKEWELAFGESNTMISSGVYSWQSDLNNVFKKESPSIIWQLKPEFEGSPTSEGEIFVSDFAPPYLYALTLQFIDHFEEGDLRREFWIKEISDGTQIYYQPYKYKQNSFEGNSSEYSILFRLAEQYLIRAESSLNLGNLQEGKQDINMIRQRAGLPPTTANSIDELSLEILNQRKYELFTEQGHRWFDLKRNNKAEQILGPIKIGWKSTDVLFPIPQKELLLNPNLKPQNPGY